MNRNKIPFFREEASGYGLDDDSHTTQANFFDYDNDGDLDVYLVVNEINAENFPISLPARNEETGRNPSTGKLFRNDWNASLKHPVFTDVSSGSRNSDRRLQSFSHA